MDGRRGRPHHAIRALAAAHPSRRASPGGEHPEGRPVDRRPPARTAVLREGPDREDPLLQPSPPGAARTDGMGPGQLCLRLECLRRPGEAPVRVLLPSPPEPDPRPQDPGTHVAQRGPGPWSMTTTVSVVLPTLNERR